MSRIEKILESKLLGVPYNGLPQSRLEQLLMDSNLGSNEAVDAEQWDQIGQNTDDNSAQWEAIQEIGSKINEIVSTVNDMDEEVSSKIEDISNAIDQNNQALNSKISAIEDRDDQLSSEISSINNSIAQNSKETNAKFSEINADIEDIRKNALTKENVISLYPEFSIDNNGDLNYDVTAKEG